MLYSVTQYAHFDFWTRLRKDSVYLEKVIEYANSQRMIRLSGSGWTTVSFIDVLPAMSTVNPDFQVWMPSNPKRTLECLLVYLRFVEPNMASVHDVSERCVKLVGDHDAPFLWHLIEEVSIPHMLNGGISGGKSHQMGSGERFVWFSAHDPQIDFGFGQNKETAFS